MNTPKLPPETDARNVADRLFEMAIVYHCLCRHNQHFERCDHTHCIENRRALGISGYQHGYRRWDERDTGDNASDTAPDAEQATYNNL